MKDNLIVVIQQHIEKLNRGIAAQRDVVNKTNKRDALFALEDYLSNNSKLDPNIILGKLSAGLSGKGYTGALFSVAAKLARDPQAHALLTKGNFADKPSFPLSPQMKLLQAVNQLIVTLWVDIEQHSLSGLVRAFFLSSVAPKQTQVKGLLDLASLLVNEKLTEKALGAIRFRYTSIITIEGGITEYSHLDAGLTFSLFQQAESLAKTMKSSGTELQPRLP